MIRTLYLYCTLLLLPLLTSCIEDKVSTSPAQQPEFSTRQLDMGTLFSEVPSPTFSFRVYNRYDRIMHIERITLRDNGSTFRMNVDGHSGNEAYDIEIRPNDSIFVFVEATLPRAGHPSPATVVTAIDFLTNGVVTSLPVTVSGRDAVRLTGSIATDTRLTAEYPYLVTGTLTVESGATLSLSPGTTLCFHDGARLTVGGTLVSEGTLRAPVTMGGDRTGFVVSDIPFHIMSRQWDGIEFTSTSRGNRMAYTSVDNTSRGVSIAGQPSDPVDLTLVNCRLHNSAGYVLEAAGAHLTALGCEFTDAAAGVMALDTGSYRLDHCTLANYYLFSMIEGPCIQILSPATRIDITNSIIFGLSSDIAPADLRDYDITVRSTLLKSSGSDDDIFSACLWNSDPLFLTDRGAYLFDYRLKPDSPAVGKADQSLSLDGPDTDFYGTDRSLTLGAFGIVTP